MPAIPPWAQAYMEDIRKHGPLPPNYQPFSKDGKVFYKEVESRNEFNFFPTSPEGRNKNVPLVQDKETCVSCIGSILPRFTYTAAEWSWLPKRDHVAALSAALLSSGARKNNQEATVERTTSELASLSKGNQPAAKIWHPADRNTPIFQDEAKVAEIARAFGRSLVMYLLKLHWGKRKGWQEKIPLQLKQDAPKIFSGFLKFPDTIPEEFLAWILVATHRTFLWSLNEIKRDQIGSYIQQYGQHIAANAPAAWKACEPKLFTFDPNKKYTGQRVDFWDIHNFICAIGPNSLVGKYAALWDNAIQAKMQYDEKSHPTDKDWDFVVDKLARMSYANVWSQVVKKK